MGMATAPNNMMSTADYVCEIERLWELLCDCWIRLEGLGPRYRECFDLDDLFAKLREFEPKEDL